MVTFILTLELLVTFIISLEKQKKSGNHFKWGRAVSPCLMYDIARQFPVAHQLVWSRSLQREDGREIVGETHLYSPRSFTLVTDFFNSILFFSGKEKGLTFRIKVCAGNRNHRRFKFYYVAVPRKLLNWAKNLNTFFGTKTFCKLLFCNYLMIIWYFNTKPRFWSIW